MAKKQKNKAGSRRSVFVRFKHGVANLFKAIMNRRDSEYSKRLLNRITNHSILMMWGTYVLAWFGKTDIAEALSKTIATSIISVVVGYLVKSVIENISKHTDLFGKNNTAIPVDDMIAQAQERSANLDSETFVNINRDC